jgi:hypothetical protein
MMDWSDLTGELPKAAEPATRAPESRGRARTSDVRTGDIRAGGRVDTPPAPPTRPGPEPVARRAFAQNRCVRAQRCLRRVHPWDPAGRAGWTARGWTRRADRPAPEWTRRTG